MLCSEAMLTVSFIGFIYISYAVAFGAAVKCDERECLH
jgi:hypothetical protein